MELYISEPRFNIKTGKSDVPVKIWKEKRCDFSGEVVLSKDSYGYPAYYCMYKLDYQDQDPCFGSDGDEFDFGEKYGIYMFDFLYEPYVILNDYSGDKGSKMKAFLKEVSNYDSLDDALRSMRIKTAKKLIEKGIISPEDLKFVTNE